MEWISVERKPTGGDAAMLVAAGRYVALADWSAAESRFEFTTREDAAIIRTEDITHWMPLPELPKERHNDWDRELFLCDGVTVESRVPGTPVQYTGKADSQKYYFRARGEQWEMIIGETVDKCVDASLTDDPLKNAEFYCTGRYGNSPFEAGYMPLEQAESIIRRGVRMWRDAREMPEASGETSKEVER